MLRFLATLAALLLWLAPLPAFASVVVTFWSHELGNSFPHAFITLRGQPDAGGPSVDGDWGFTPVSISPKMLWGPVHGAVEHAPAGYIRHSDAQFSVVLNDAQYIAILSLLTEWSDKGDPTYRLGTRNCVHFTQAAARRAGLTKVDFPGLMKKPRSYLKAVAAANPGRLTVLDQRGDRYLASLPALPGAVVPLPVKVGEARMMPAN